MTQGWPLLKYIKQFIKQFYLLPFYIFFKENMYL